MKVGALFILVALVSPYPTVSVALWLVGIGMLMYGLGVRVGEGSISDD